MASDVATRPQAAVARDAALIAGDEVTGMTELWASYAIPVPRGYRFFLSAAALDEAGTFITVPFAALTIGPDGALLDTEEWLEFLQEAGFDAILPAHSGAPDLAAELELAGLADRLKAGDIAALGRFRELFLELAPPEHVPFYRKLEPGFMAAVAP